MWPRDRGGALCDNYQSCETREQTAAGPRTGLRAHRRTASPSICAASTELEAAGVETVSSQGLAERFKLNAAQIRKDLACFGEFGVRGVGYYVKDLRRDLRQILGLDRTLRVAIIGAGNLGPGAGRLPRFSEEGFEIVALFDTHNGKVGHVSRGGITIHDIRQLKRIVRQRAVEHRRHRRAGIRGAGRSSTWWSQPGSRRS